MTSGKKDLLEYEIQEWEVFVHDSGDMSVAEVKIVFRRWKVTNLAQSLQPFMCIFPGKLNITFLAYSSNRPSSLWWDSWRSCSRWPPWRPGWCWPPCRWPTSRTGWWSPSPSCSSSPPSPPAYNRWILSKRVKSIARFGQPKTFSLQLNMYHKKEG